MRTVDGKTTFLTGAASGIGKALAEALAAAGSHLFLVDVDGESLQSVRQHVEQTHGVRADACVCDLSQPDQVDAMLAVMRDVMGIPDIVINNAGIAYYGPTDVMTQQQWDRLISINLLAPIRILTSLLPDLMSKDQPHIVNMCSISGLVAGGKFAAYHTSKFGLVGYTDALRAEYCRRGIGVSSICPGPVTTGLYKSAVSGRPGKAVPTPPRWICTTPERVAALTLRAIRKNKRQVLITPMAHALFNAKRFLPGVLDFATRFGTKGLFNRRSRVATPPESLTAGARSMLVSVMETPNPANTGNRAA